MAVTSEWKEKALREAPWIAGALVVAAVCIVLAAQYLSSCSREVAEYQATQEEAERLMSANINDTDPATLTPHHGLPLVIADDDAFHIEITGTPILLDGREVTGYERLLSYEGYVFKLAIENKTEHLAIQVGGGNDPWIATGVYPFDGERVHEEDMEVEFYGSLNHIEAGESVDWEFTLFSREHGSLYGVDSLYGVFEVQDAEDHTVLARYPFSYEADESDSSVYVRT